MFQGNEKCFLDYGYPFVVRFSYEISIRQLYKGEFFYVALNGNLDIQDVIPELGLSHILSQYSIAE